MNDNTQAILEAAQKKSDSSLGHGYWISMTDLEEILIAQEEENNEIPHECIRCQNLYQDGCDWHCGLKDYAPPNCPVKIPVYPAPPEEGK